MTVPEPTLARPQAEAAIMANPVAATVDFLARQADAAIVCDGNGDDVVATLLAQGWRQSDRVHVIFGKRIRYLEPPEPL